MHNADIQHPTTRAGPMRIILAFMMGGANLAHRVTHAASSREANYVPNINISRSSPSKHATGKGQSACARPNGFLANRFEGEHRFVI